MRAKLLRLWKEYTTEWREKVEWPSWAHLFNTTVTVLVGSFLIAIVIGLIDLVFSTIMRGLYSLF
ncbi:MAG: preprotein translocase subunit SecE [Bacteroidia bacterium]|nr:preprotein translocase subunit SecE [Bacteroidia bacterium]MDW8088496.1 preprotein translocase subunit SecE [Bacteroidia bacterium]